MPHSKMKEPIQIGALLCCILLLGCAAPFKSLFLLKPDTKDVDRMALSVVKAPEIPFEFTRSNSDWGSQLKVNDWSPVVPVWRNLNELVNHHPNEALVVIRNDTILYENYKDSNPEKLLPSYSVAKSFTSALVGFAIQDGFINSLDEPISNYLTLDVEDERFDSITIGQLLNHTSAIQHALTVDALLYYGNDLSKANKHIELKNDPGTDQSYMNMNIWLLGQILEKTIGTTLVEYLEQKLWKPLGMENEAKWAKDKNGHTKPYCCLHAKARDYAKFGRLYLNKGNWNGKQLLNQEWIENTLKRDTTDGGTFGYRNSWYLGYAEYNDFMAIGLHKQHLYVNPDKNVIIVSLNTRPKTKAQSTLNWEDICRQIVDQL